MKNYLFDYLYLTLITCVDGDSWKLHKMLIVERGALRDSNPACTRLLLDNVYLFVVGALLAGNTFNSMMWSATSDDT